MAITGDLTDVGIAEVIQLLNATRKTGVLTVSAGGDTYTIYCRNGRIVHATGYGREGEEVIYELVGHNSGYFHFEQGQIDSPATIKADTLGLIMEGMRRLDEAERDTGVRPARVAAPGEAAPAVVVGQRVDWQRVAGVADADAEKQLRTSLMAFDQFGFADHHFLLTPEGMALLAVLPEGSDYEASTGAASQVVKLCLLTARQLNLGEVKTITWRMTDGTVCVAQLGSTALDYLVLLVAVTDKAQAALLSLEVQAVCKQLGGLFDRPWAPRDLRVVPTGGALRLESVHPMTVRPETRAALRGLMELFEELDVAEQHVFRDSLGAKVITILGEKMPAESTASWCSSLVRTSNRYGKSVGLGTMERIVTECQHGLVVIGYEREQNAALVAASRKEMRPGLADIQMASATEMLRSIRIAVAL